MKVAAIVPAAGDGRRLGSRAPKPFVVVHKKPILVWTITHLKKAFRFREIILVAKSTRIASTQALLHRYWLESVRVVPGGKTRAESVLKGLDEVSADCDLVLVHDVARPLVQPKTVKAVLRAAGSKGAAICALPIADTVKKVSN